MESATRGSARVESHRITAVRDDVVLHVEASSGRLVVRLFEAYLERLDWRAPGS